MFYSLRECLRHYFCVCADRYEHYVDMLLRPKENNNRENFKNPVNSYIVHVAMSMFINHFCISECFISVRKSFFFCNFDIYVNIRYYLQLHMSPYRHIN